MHNLSVLKVLHKLAQVNIITVNNPVFLFLFDKVQLTVNRVGTLCYWTSISTLLQLFNNLFQPTSSLKKR